jgi:energy-coupling factor transporter transmembrane protein EcfT
MRPARFGPLSVLAVCLLAVVGATAIHTAWHGVLSVAALLVLTPLALRSWPATVRRLSLGLVAAVSVAVSTWLYGGRELDTAIGASMRILYIVVPAAVLSSLVDPARLGDHLAQRLRLPARPVVAATVALQRLESIDSQWQQIGRARRARGVGPDGGPLRRARAAASMALALLVSTMRMSGAMSLAMEARGFGGATRRTWAEAAPWQWRDSAILGGAVLVAVGPWVLPALAGSLSPVG